MVIIQGSLLDRIDFNIEEARDNVVKGADHIDKAEEYQKKGSNCAFRTMIVFLIGIAILSVVLAIKWTRNSSSA
jgi:t-SNARE complex subunit (syntaxin)